MIALNHAYGDPDDITIDDADVETLWRAADDICSIYPDKQQLFRPVKQVDPAHQARILRKILKALYAEQQQRKDHLHDKPLSAHEPPPLPEPTEATHAWVRMMLGRIAPDYLEVLSKKNGISMEEQREAVYNRLLNARLHDQ